MANFAANFVPSAAVAGPPGSIASAGTDQKINETSAVQKFALGTRIRAQDPVLGEAEFIYAKGVAGTAAGDVVTINGDNTTTRLVARGKGLVGIAMSANVANQFGWYCVFGAAPAKTNAAVAAGAQAYATVTAGAVDDAVVAGDFLSGAQFATADAGTPAGQSLALAANFAILRVAYSAACDADNA